MKAITFRVCSRQTCNDPIKSREKKRINQRSIANREQEA